MKRFKSTMLCLVAGCWVAVTIPVLVPVAPADVTKASSPYWQALNVRDFGATGDGVTDDTHAIQSALNVGQACLVRIPAGKYRVSQLKIPAECRVLGDGCNQTWLCPILGPESVEGPILTDQGNAQKIQIEHLGILGENRVSKGLVELGYGKEQWGTQGVISACQFRDCAGYGVRLSQNISLIEKSYILRCGTALDVSGNSFAMRHNQILGAKAINIQSPCFIDNLEIEAPQGPVAIHFGRRANITGLHVSLSQSLTHAMEFEQKAGSLIGWLFDAKPGAKCKWAKYPGGEIDKPGNFAW